MIRTAAISFLIATLASGAQAVTGMQTAVDLCLDTGLTIPTRAAAFEEAGWQAGGTPLRAREAFVEALVIGTIDATDSSGSRIKLKSILQDHGIMPASLRVPGTGCWTKPWRYTTRQLQ